MKRVLSLLAVCAGAATAQTGFSVAAIDKSVEPCNDFYRYACGNWIRSNPIPSDQSRWGRFNELQDRNLNILKDILETAAAKTQRSAVEQKIGDYYSSCMDEKGVETKGTAPLKPVLDRLVAVKEKKDFAEEIARLQKVGAPVFFAVGGGADYKNSKVNIAHAVEGGLTLPDRDYYLKDDPRSAGIRKAYGEHVTKMFSLLGYSQDQATAATRAVLKIETELATATMDRVARRNPLNRYHMTSLIDFVGLAPSFNWRGYARNLDMPMVEKLNVTNPDFFKALEKTWTSATVDEIRQYLTWHYLHLSAPFLPGAFVNENFAFFGRTLTGAKELQPRWKRCVNAVDADLAEALGQKYVEQT
ncbi:MAG TPA: M13 family metallopeptidase N-terminal domain-containing protein, partial [Bryobacteraceae bacterium]|nr:M13 family metallopeptidase N-terminal domain-containing protein [Bryobacteraceae bacterium]